jgi:N-dimethylarginine dimethylaminohydrolase
MPNQVIAGQNEIGTLRKVLLKHPRDAFRSRDYIREHWDNLNYLRPPDFFRAVREFEQFVRILEDAGTEVFFLPQDERTGLDSIYVRDASLVSDRGIISARMGKEARLGEPEAAADYYEQGHIPVLGEITDTGRLEGGDAAWLDRKTLTVGEGYRTNAEGIRQLQALFRHTDVDILPVPLPHWRGPGDVLHLMSLLSPVGPQTALVYSRLMAVPFRKELLNRGFTLIEVPDEEYPSMGGNVLCLGRGRCLMLSGNPQTRRSLEKAGFDVLEYEGKEISIPGSGGPTCLTRPLLRDDS